MSETDRIVQENIYRDVIEKIESLLSETSAEDISDARITTLYQETRNQLSSVSETLTKELQSLQEHSEWDSFTVAFYGETNAGKSTLVEALRILLNEETKIKERALYANTYKRLTALQNKSSMIEQEIKGLQEEKDNKTQELMASIGAATKALETIDDRLKYAIALIEANNLARADLRTNSTGDFFRVLLGKDEYSEKNGSLREEIPKLKLEYKECKSKIDIYNNNLESESEVFDLKIKPLEEEKIILDQEIAPLKVAIFNIFIKLSLFYWKICCFSCHFHAPTYMLSQRRQKFINVNPVIIHNYCYCSGFIRAIDPGANSIKPFYKFPVRMAIGVAFSAAYKRNART